MKLIPDLISLGRFGTVETVRGGGCFYFSTVDRYWFDSWVEGEELYVRFGRLMLAYSPRRVVEEKAKREAADRAERLAKVAADRAFEEATLLAAWDARYAAERAVLAAAQ